MHSAVYAHTHTHRLVRALAARIARVSRDLNSQNVANTLWSLCWLCSRFPEESVAIAASVGPRALQICSRLLLRYCCVTAALLLLYCCFTAASLLLYFSLLRLSRASAPAQQARCDRRGIQRAGAVCPASGAALR
jgi:hypothetical protein